MSNGELVTSEREAMREALKRVCHTERCNRNRSYLALFRGIKGKCQCGMETLRKIARVDESDPPAPPSAPQPPRTRRLRISGFGVARERLDDKQDPGVTE